MRNFLASSVKAFIFSAILFTLVLPSSAQLSLRKALDVNGDGRADYTIFRQTDNIWHTLLSSGGKSVATFFGIAGIDMTAPGDYDGDGKGDVAVFREIDGDWYWMNSSNRTFTVRHFGSPGDEPVARDWDGDGKTDLAVVRRSNGVMIWFIEQSSNGAIIQKEFGAASDFTAPGDYDGDGKFDMAIQRPGTTAASRAVFHILSSQTGTVTATQWGRSTDLVIPGDYDGDGKTDIAVLREGVKPTDNLTWLIRRSAGGKSPNVVFGITGSDYNVQNDYDGDGKTDIAVYRNGTPGAFYVLRSSNGVVSTVPWGLENDFPVASYDTH